MANNRGGAGVRALRWRGDGEEVVIACGDGHVLVGSVGGERVWSRDLSGALTQAAWSPDGQRLLLAGADGSVTVYAAGGVRVGPLVLHALREPAAEAAGGGAAAAAAAATAAAVRTPVAALEWYDETGGVAYPGSPALAVGFAGGLVHLLRDVDDAKPVILDTGLRLAACRWSGDGTVLAVAGVRAAAAATAEAAAQREQTEVQFYSPFGRFLACLGVPGGAVASLAWESGGLRLAVSCWLGGGSRDAHGARSGGDPYPSSHP